MEEALLALLDRHDLRSAASSEWRVLIQSFSERSLRKIHALDPELPLIQLLHARWQTPRTVQAALRDISEYAVGIGPSWRDVDERVIRAARDACLDVHPYTVNDPLLMRTMSEIGVAGMFTDTPDVLLAQRPSSELRGRAAVAGAAQRQRDCRRSK
jgi:glycerophosphoryl diester phosphodiesterase